MKRSTDRYLTTHVGSMVRPDDIRDATQTIAEGKPVDIAKFESQLKDEVAKVVKEQADTGVDIISDGEFGKSAWTGYIMERIEGFELREIPRPPITLRGLEAEGRFRGYYDMADAVRRRPTISAVCVGPIKYTDEGRRVMKRDVENFKAALKNVKVEEAFLPVVAPASIAVHYKNEYYKTEEEFLFAMAEALHEEYKIIVDSGFILQTDDAILCNLHDTVVASGQNYRKWVGMNLAALNHGLEGIPEDRVRYHLCWGSWPGPHSNDVPLAEILDLVLTIKAQGYSIEGANPRHEHEWKLWKDTKLPDGKVLIPGVISHAITHIEHPELIADRIERYASVVGPENVIASSDCGFAQNSAILRQHPSVVFAKLEALAQGAEIASKRRK